MTDSITREMIESPTVDPLMAEMLTRDYRRFAEVCWAKNFPNLKFKRNWHTDCVADHMQNLAEGSDRHVLFILPPRHTKSTLTSQFWHPWIWLRQPGTQFISAAFANWRAESDMVVSKEIIMHPWYQQVLANRPKKYQFQMIKERQEEIRNNMFGVRRATGRGNISGQNADFVIIDDCLGSDEMYSDAALMRLKIWWTETISQRFNDPSTGRFVIIGQRLSPYDIQGLIHNLEVVDVPEQKLMWNVVAMPTEFIADHPTPFKTNVICPETGKPWVDPRKKPGELLFPQHFGPKQVEDRKRKSQKAYRMQHLGLTAQGEEGYFKRKWFTVVPEKILQHMKVHYVWQSWDTAFTEKKLLDVDKGGDPSESVCSTWKLVSMKGQDPKMKYMFLADLYAGFIRFSDLRKKAVELHDKFDPDIVLIEKQANGASLIQELQDLKISVGPFNPADFGGKKLRAATCEAVVSEGRILVPDWIPGCDYLIDAMVAFPTAGQDVTDSATQAILWMRDKVLLEDDPLPEKKKFGQKSPWKTVNNDPKWVYTKR